MSIKVDITEDCKNDLKYDQSLAACIYKNYIVPIQAGSALPGRFKPSWLVNFTGSMRDLFAQKAKEQNLYHYHIGYKYYKKSSDTTYPGDVSDGIVHVIVITDNETKETVHKLIKVSVAHDPFILPLERMGG